MSEGLVYLLQVSVVSALLYICYRLVFRRMSFFSLNRWTILVMIGFSLFCPLIELPYSPEDMPAVFDEWTETVSELEESVLLVGSPKPNATKWEWEHVVWLVYGLGLLMGMVRLGIQVNFILRLRQRARPIEIEGVRYWQTDHPSAPFAVGNWMFVPTQDDASMLVPILLHEKAHVSRGHILDLFILECYCLLLWFSPFSYRLKRELRAIHEYQADADVIEQGIDLTDYLQILGSSANVQLDTVQLSIPHMFTSSTFINRIHMMTDRKTAGWQKALYVLWLPILGSILVSFMPRQMESFPLQLPEPVRPPVESRILDEGEEIPSIMPILEEGVRLTSGFGMRMHPKTKKKQHHRGVDFGAPLGTPVVATAPGTIVENQYKGKGVGFGKMVIIKHSDTYYTRYAHLDSFEAEVGQKVSRGQMIGRVGSSGVSFGPHLHYEVWKDGKAVNPAKYYAQ